MAKYIYSLSFLLVDYWLVAIGRAMKIKGEYKEILSRNVEIISDTCRESNEIAACYGIFLAALMKNVFYGLVGTENRSMVLTRSILLTFPIEEKEVVS